MHTSDERRDMAKLTEKHDGKKEERDGSMDVDVHCENSREEYTETKEFMSIGPEVGTSVIHMKSHHASTILKMILSQQSIM